MSHINNRRKTARLRAGLKAKKRKERMRKADQLTKRKGGARMKPKSGGWSVK